MNTENEKNKFRIWMYGQMRVENVFQRDIGKALNLSQQGVSYKMKHCQFNYEELLVLFRLLKADSDTILGLMSASA